MDASRGGTNPRARDIISVPKLVNNFKDLTYKFWTYPQTKNASSPAFLSYHLSSMAKMIIQKRKNDG